MSLDCSLASDEVPRFPRVSGDEPIQLTHTQKDEKFSPRERG
mgnify:CR=1 FL=1